jgi:hypothetical protein
MLADASLLGVTRGRTVTAGRLFCSSENRHSRRPPRATAAILSAAARSAPRTSSYFYAGHVVTIQMDLAPSPAQWREIRNDGERGGDPHDVPRRVRRVPLRRGERA